jgi:hypothetical protein
MSVELMKKAILEAYNSAPKWKDKVSRMSDKQIMATYFSMLDRRVLK